MKPTAMPVYRPTASCIERSFRSSGKRHLLITGGRGSGKTTLINELCPAELPGLTSRAESGKAVWLRSSTSGETAQIGRFDPSLPGVENLMRPCPEGLLGLGVSTLESCCQAGADRVVIDEIGYLEADCLPYQQAILRLMEKKSLVAAVRRQPLAFLDALLGREDVFRVDLDDPFGCTGCIIMASGEGRRFGGNKLMADFHGEPMICRALAATDGLFARRIVVTRHESVADLCRERNVEYVLHDQPLRSDTVRIGLEAMGEADGCLFCPGDQPLLSRETVAALLLAARQGATAIWRTAFEGTPGSPVLFPRELLPALRHLPAGKGGGWLAGKHSDRVRLLPVCHQVELMDADTPEALRVLQMHWL